MCLESKPPTKNMSWNQSVEPWEGESQVSISLNLIFEWVLFFRLKKEVLLICIGKNK